MSLRPQHKLELDKNSCTTKPYDEGRRRNLKNLSMSCRLWGCLELILDRSDEIVVRGSTAMAIVHQMSSRVPSLIEQSHLENTEGNTHPLLIRHGNSNTLCSLDGILVTNPQDTNPSMPESVSRDSSTSFWCAAANITVERACISQP